MGLFDGIGKVLETGIKVATTPIAVAKDIVDVSLGCEPNNTEKHLVSTGKSIEQAIDKLTGNDF